MSHLDQRTHIGFLSRISAKGSLGMSFFTTECTDAVRSQRRIDGSCKESWKLVLEIERGTRCL